MTGRRSLNNLDDDIRDHIERETQDNVDRGMLPDDARAAAHRKFGNVALVKEDTRAVWIPVWVDQLRQDGRYALRMLRRSPGFSAIVILTLGIGIGLSTAIFSVVNAVLLRPLPYRDVTRLVAIHERLSKLGGIPVANQHFDEWRRSSPAFERLALLWGISVNLTGSGEPERLAAARVSPSLFAMLGVPPQLGRALQEDEDQPGRDRVVVIADALWRRRFGSDPAIVGRSILLDDEPHVVIGVMPPGFVFPNLKDLYPISIASERAELWKPLVFSAAEIRSSLGGFNFACIGQVRSGVSISQAAAELNALEAQLGKASADTLDLRAEVVPLQRQITGRSRSGLGLLAGAVAAVMLIGWVNVINLLLARGAARSREVAMRCAIGAGRGRLVRQLLTESLVLAGAGAACGIVMAWGTLRLLLALAPPDLPRLDEVRIDTAVLLFAVGAALATGVVIGVLPAWRSMRIDLQEAMKSGAGAAATGNRRGRRMQSMLVSLEVGLTAVCLIAAGLLFRSFVRVLNVDKGFESGRIVSVSLSLPERRYQTLEQRVAFQRALVARLQALPGVESIAISNKPLLSGEGVNTRLSPEATTLTAPQRPMANLRAVNADYFRTLGVSIRSGRVFDERDSAQPVAVLSAAAAERLWPGQNAIGRRFRRGADSSPLVEVVGVAADVRGSRLDKQAMYTAYIPYWQYSTPAIAVDAKAVAEPLSLAPALHHAIRTLDSELPIPPFRTMDAIVVGSIADRVFQMRVVLLFGAAALVLAAVGIYGVMAYVVTQRTREIGLRLALGARRAAVLRMVLADACRPLTTGLLLGVSLAVGAGTSLRSLLFGVEPQDVTTIIATCVVLTITAMCAAYLPARRAAAVDPLIALRCE
jgi:putative ABC transport system permease protein